MQIPENNVNYSIFDDKSVLVTGGTGTFGKAFIKRMLERCAPSRLIVFSRDELKQYEMQNQLQYKSDCLRFFIGDVRERDRLTMAMQNVDYVVHAAALKHVPIAEYNPFECVKTNINGAENVVHAAIDAGVSRVIALSTDKAVNPINLYGATKLASDKIFVAANNLTGKKNTRFSIVRYGNVLGSRGSVIPHFASLVRSGAKKLPITDPQMTRFWLEIEDGVDFVVSSFSKMNGGEIFIPKIPSMRITDLAEAFLPNAEFEIIGLRPGEKMHEIMISTDDAPNTYETDDAFIIYPFINFVVKFDQAHEDVKKVGKNFSYSSDNNSKWIKSENLKTIINKYMRNEAM